jgi:hypothetical protein
MFTTKNWPDIRNELNTATAAASAKKKQNNIFFRLMT